MWSAARSVPFPIAGCSSFRVEFTNSWRTLFNLERKVNYFSRATNFYFLKYSCFNSSLFRGRYLIKEGSLIINPPWKKSWEKLILLPPSLGNNRIPDSSSASLHPHLEDLVKLFDYLLVIEVQVRLALFVLMQVMCLALLVPCPS